MTTSASVAERFAALGAPVRAQITRDELAHLEHCWRFWARPEQIAPSWEWSTWLVLAGRGFGKTRSGAEWVREEVDAGVRRIALVGASAASVRDVIVEGESGILAVFPPHQRPRYEPSKRRVTFHTGATATLFSAEEPDQLRGPQHERALCDEFASWRYVDETWSNLQMGLRLGQRPRSLIATTPRPIALLRELLAGSLPTDPDGNPQTPTVAVTRGSTYANRANLPRQFIDQISKQYGGTRLGRQELEGEILDDVDALFQGSWIQHVGEGQLPPMRRVIIAIDPAISTTCKSDETGILVVGLGTDERGYVLADLSGKLSPDEWARRVIRSMDEYGAREVIAEVNRGGDLVEDTLKTRAPHIRFRAVRALKGKGTRAEPVAALYEQGRVSHVMGLRKLEDQMVTWDPIETPDSPDRLDALVHGLTELLVHEPPPRIDGGLRPQRRRF